ncbi:MAG TPA: hypothetical protein VIL28_15605 [Steroidobacteraceae bacterium]
MKTPAPSADSSLVVTALFRDIRDAEQAYQAACKLGYEPDEVNVLMSEATRDAYLKRAPADTPLAEKASEPAPDASKRAEVLGGPAGGTVGTVTPAIAAIGAALLVPGLGLVAAGPIAIALTAAGTAGLATGLIGAFTNWGIPPDRIEHYENAIRKGAVVLGVETKSDAQRNALIEQWREANGETIET